MNIWYIYSKNEKIDLEKIHNIISISQFNAIPSFICLYDKPDLYTGEKLYKHGFSIDIYNNNILVISTIHELIEFAGKYTISFSGNYHTKWKAISEEYDALLILNFDYIRRVLNLERNIKLVKSAAWFMQLRSNCILTFNTDILSTNRYIKK